MVRYRRSVSVTVPVLLALAFTRSTGQVAAGVINSGSPVRVVSEDSFGLVLDFDLPSFTVDSADGRCRVSIEGWARTSKPGAADVPFTGALIELPPGFSARAAVLSCEEASLAAQAIALLPPLSNASVDLDADAVRCPSAGGTAALPAGSASGFTESASSPLVNGSPYPSVRIEKPVTIRGLSAARLLIYPFSWDEESSAIRYWQKARIAIVFQKSDREQRNSSARLKVSPTQGVPPAILDTSPGSPYPPGPRVRIEVTEDGLYQVSSIDLARLGLMDGGASPRSLQLWCRGNQVPFTIVRPNAPRVSGIETRSTDRGRFFLRFYGTAAQSPYTTANVYWITAAGMGGARMGSRDASPLPGQNETQGWFDETVRREENEGTWDQTPGAPDAEFWFWERLTAPMTKTYTVQLAGVSSDQPAEGHLKIWFRGRSTHSSSPNHHVEVLWDNLAVGEFSWTNTSEYVAEIRLPKAKLTAGEHSVTLDAPGDTGAPVDAFYLDKFEVRYGRLLQPGNSNLRFQINAATPKTVEVTCSPGDPVDVFDVTDELNVTKLESLSIQVQPDRQLIRFLHPGTAPATYYLARQAKKPISVDFWNPEGIRDGRNRADYLIIAPREFGSAILSLRQFRGAQGLLSRIVSTEEIFNEFSHGFPEPEGIKSFLSYAYHNWAPPAPAYVLFVGDATADYRDYLKTGKANKVPVHLTFSAFGLIPDDSWYVCVDDVDPNDSFPDPVPDLMLGRIPGASSSAVAQTVSKIIQFEQSGGKANSRVLAVADNGETVWQDTSEKLANLIPAYFTTEKIYLRVTTAAQAKTDLLNALSAGPALATYVGHGNTQTWAGELILQPADVPKIGNGPENLSFVIALNCLNAYFSSPHFYSLGEELVNAPNKAAVAFFAPTGLSFPLEHEILGLELLSAIFEDRELRLGKAIARARVNAYAKGVTGEALGMFTLLGDPATRLKGW